MLISIPMAGDFNKCPRPQLSQSNTGLVRMDTMRLRHTTAMLRILMGPISVYGDCELWMKCRDRLDPEFENAAARQLTKCQGCLIILRILPILLTLIWIGHFHSKEAMFH